MRTLVCENLYDFREVTSYLDAPDVKENEVLEKYWYLPEGELIDLLEADLAEALPDINEANIKELMSKGLDAVKKWFAGVLKTLAKAAHGAKAKFLKMLKSVAGTLKRFEKKYPMLVKIIVVFLVILLILAMTAQSAQATGPDGSEVDAFINMLNGAIGIVDDLEGSGTGVDILDLRQAKAYLADLKSEYQGGADDVQFNDLEKGAQNVVKSVMQQAHKMFVEDSENASKYQDLVRRGQQFIDGFIQKSEFLNGKEYVIRFEMAK